MHAGSTVSRLHPRPRGPVAQRRFAVRLGVVWAFAALLVLKAALPWLAGEAAERQGRLAAEVCSVHGYGVAVQASGVDARSTDAAVPGDPLPASGGLHGDTGCPLLAFATLASGAGSLHGLPPALAPPAPAHVVATRSTPPADAAAAWRALRQHAPPPRPSLG